LGKKEMGEESGMCIKSPMAPQTRGKRGLIKRK